MRSSSSQLSSKGPINIDPLNQYQPTFFLSSRNSSSLVLYPPPMQFLFAAVMAWFLFFTERVKAHVNGTDSILQSIYKQVLQSQDVLPGEDVHGEDVLGKDVLGLVWSDGRLLVKVISKGDDAETLLAPIFVATGLQMVACNLYACEGFLPMINFPALSADGNVQAIYPSMSMTEQAGSKVSEALQSLKVDLVRASDSSLTGDGLRIGIMSDSFDILKGYAADIQSRDLPGDVTVLKEYTGDDGVDEGRAMAQLVHDLIPGAQLFFRTANIGQIDFAKGIQELADAGCDVIVDDMRYNEAPFFQDGVIAQSANDVAEIRGVPYFSSAGNNAKQSWEGTFQGSGLFNNKGCQLHDFGGNDTRQSIFAAENSEISFQWEDPFRSVSGGSGASRDMDLKVYFQGSLFDKDTTFNKGGDPLAIVYLPGGHTYELEFSICTTDTSPPPLMKWIAFGEVSNIEFDTQSSTSFGHKNTAFTAGVGAAFFQKTPAFRTDPPALMSSSSRGGTPILFDRSGARLATNEIRMQPRFVATTGCINTFFGDFLDLSPNGKGFYFFGTSAAAPNAASVAILMLQKNPKLTPHEIYSILGRTAIDMNTAGFDFDSGYGLIDARRAVDAACATLPPTLKGTTLKRAPLYPMFEPMSALTKAPKTPKKASKTPKKAPKAPKKAPKAPKKAPKAPK